MFKCAGNGICHAGCDILLASVRRNLTELIWSSESRSSGAARRGGPLSPLGGHYVVFYPNLDRNGRLAPYLIFDTEETDVSAYYLYVCFEHHVLAMRLHKRFPFCPRLKVAKRLRSS